MRSLRIALAQINPTVGDFAGNGGRIRDAINRAKSSGAGLVSVPELSLSGYPPEDLLLKRSFLKDCRRELDRLAAEVSGIAAVVGFPSLVGKSVHNSAALIHDGQVKAVYHKVELPNYGVFDEKRYFKRGTKALIVRLGEVRVMITICEDIWVARASVEKRALAYGPEVVLNLSASPFYAGKLGVRRKIIERFARRTGTIVAYDNLVGGQDELIFDGGSLVMSPRGEALAQAGRFEEDLLVVDLEVDRILEARGADEPKMKVTTNHGLIEVALPARVDRPALSATRAPELSRPQARAPELSRIEEIWSALALGTRDYVTKNGFKKVLIGLSGGIDSALTAAIAARALGPDQVVAVTMPSPFSSKETRSDAALLAANLGIRLLSIPITGIFGAFREELEPVFGAGPDGLEYENLQARIRGNLLMALSNRNGWIVLTTGNKSETAVGYSTLYGDTAGGFAVIKDVPKTVVYELAHHFNRLSGRDLIPQSMIERPPTAELRPGQKDEDSLPPYPVLDAILEAYVEQDRGPDEIAALGFDLATVQDVIRMVDKNEYKRRQAPPGIKITPKAFGRDRRLPITSRYRHATKGDSS